MSLKLSHFIEGIININFSYYETKSISVLFSAKQSILYLNLMLIDLCVSNRAKLNNMK